MTKQARALRTRQRLLDTACELLASKGTTGTTFDAIAEASGLSRGLVRFHFGSKHGLLLAVVERVFADYQTHIETELIGHGAAPSSIESVLTSHRDFVRENETTGRLFFILLFEALGPNPDLLPRFIELGARMRHLSVEWIERAEAAGVIIPGVDVDALANIMLGVFGGLRYQWYVDPDAMDLDRIYATLNEILVRALTPKDAAPEIKNVREETAS